jgi:hypothetical protein
MLRMLLYRVIPWCCECCYTGSCRNFANLAIQGHTGMLLYRVIPECCECCYTGSYRNVANFYIQGHNVMLRILIYSVIPWCCECCYTGSYRTVANLARFFSPWEQSMSGGSCCLLILPIHESVCMDLPICLKDEDDMVLRNVENWHKDNL